MAGRGIHISLARDEAKRLFALKEDTQVRAFVDEVSQSKKYRENDLILDTGTAWDPIHRCLTDGELDPEGGDFPENQCILGGKHLYKGDDFIVSLVRPDIVAHVAETLTRIKRDEFSSRYFALDPQSYGRQPTDEEFTAVWIAFKLIRDFYADAAEERSAVVFAAEL